MRTRPLEHVRQMPRRTVVEKPQSIAGLIAFSIFAIAVGCAFAAVTLCILDSLFWKGESWGPALLAMALAFLPVVLACPIGCLVGLIGVVNDCSRRRLAAIGLIGNSALLALLVLWRLAQ